MKGSSKQISIKGILIPVDWDDKGNVIKAAILTADEDEYIVEENEKGKKMLGLMQQVVEIKGVVREEVGQKVINIERYKTLKRGEIR